MKKRSRSKTCYYCSDPATSQEHVPPEQMFVGFNCSKIKVPSCDLHNGGKSFFDECILKGMLLTLHRNLENIKGLSFEVIKAINQVKGNFQQVKRGAREKELFVDGPLAEEGIKVAYLEPHIDLNSWIKKVSAGIVYNAVGANDSRIDWPSAEVHNTFLTHSGSFEDFLKWQENSQKIEKAFANCPWTRGWSSEPNPYPEKLFHFLVGAEEGYQYFQFVFYETYKFYIQISCPTEISAVILAKANRFMEKRVESAVI